MTTDLEQRVRRALDEDAGKAPRVGRAPEGLRRRVRRRQAGTAAAAVAGLAAVVALTFAGIQAFDGDDRFAPTPRDEHTRTVFERTATIEGFTVTSPSDWYLVDYWPVTGRANEITEAATRGESIPGSKWIPGAAGVPVLQLTNEDPGLGAPICGSPTGDDPFPGDGVGLYVGFDSAAMRLQDPGGGLPVWPGTIPVEGTGCEGGTFVRFGVPRGDQLLPYLLWYGAGPDASDEDRAQLDAIVDGLVVADRQTGLSLPGTDTPGFVLWGGTNEDGSTWTIEARPTDVNVDLKLVTRDADGTYSEGGFADFDVPPNDVDGGFMGVVAEEAERVEFQPTDGSAPAIAQLTDLPASLGYRADAYFFPSGYPSKTDPIDGELVAIMAPPSPSVDPATVPGGVVVDREVIGEGTHPTAGPWQLRVSLIDPGRDLPLEPSLGLRFAEHGGGNGTLQPLEGAIFRGWGSGLTNEEGVEIPLELYGPVSKLATRVIFEPNGSDEATEAMLFPIPSRFIGQAQAFLVLVDGYDRPAVKGELIAYGVDGRELDRVTVGVDREPGGVTPEIDAVIQDLEAVRDALPSEPGFDALDLDALAAEAGVDVTLGSHPTTGTVSIVVEDDQHAVLLAELPDGQILCIGAQQAWSFRYGIGAATTYEGCGGGWNGYQIPPDP